LKLILFKANIKVMSIHIGAKENDIAPAILLPGDPLRAKYIAENLLEKSVCYNEIRGMLGYTGYYKGNKVSVQGTGMGIPSLSIYVNELIREYHVKTLIRVGTCGAMAPQLKIRDIILAMCASTDSNVNKLRFGQFTYAPTASFRLLNKAFQIAKEKGIDPLVGSILSSDLFYNDHPEMIQKFSDYGVLAAEMETSELYTLAAKYQVDALSILTVSDHIVSGEHTTAAERQNSFVKMVEIALETIY
jgi:purine-nucleoside phosphorylase